MLTKESALVIIKKIFPNADIKPPVIYKDFYLFQVFTDDPEEGDQDPFFSVNQETGEVRDFSVITDGNIYEITKLFLNRS